MFTNKKSLLALSIASAFALTGCFSDDDGNDYTPPGPGPDPEVVVPPEAPAEIGAVVYGNVVDAEDSATLPSTITFYEAGVVSENVVDVDGNVTATVESEDGSFVFQLKEGADIDEVTAVVTSENYVSKSFIFDLTEFGDDDISLTLGLTSEENVAVFTSEPVTLTGGSSATEIKVPVTSTDGASSEVTIPANTVLQDANGDAVEGSVTVKLTTAKPGSASFAAIIPEGLNEPNATTVLKPAGVTSVEMLNADGVKVKQFSSPINVNMAVKAGTTGPLALSSNDEDTGKWTQETEQVAVASDIGSFTTSHLTLFAGSQSAPVCGSAITFNFDGDAIPTPSGLSLKLLSTDGNTSYNVKGSTFTIGQGKISRAGISDESTAVVQLTDAEGNVWFESDDEVALCTGGVGQTVAATLDNPIELVSETLSLTAVCSNDDTVSVGASGALVKYKLGNKGSRVAKGDGNGNYALNNMASGEDYTVTVRYKKTLAAIGTAEYTVTADGTDEAQSETLLCDTSTGGTGGTGGN